MPLQIQLTQEEKSTLIYDIMRFVVGCHKIWNRNNPRIEALWAVKCIIADQQFSVSNRGTFVKELKKLRDLWLRVSPFLSNSDGSCGTKGCPHMAASHIGGEKCTCLGIISKYVKKPVPNNPWHYELRRTPCKCTGYRPKQL